MTDEGTTPELMQAIAVLEPNKREGEYGLEVDDQ